MVAPAVDNSGQGGRLIFDTSPVLQTPSEFNLIPAGKPSLGHDPLDQKIWYYNGTPAACTLVGLDYVFPKIANITAPDLIVSGPNFGDNIGTFAFTGSGTIGATYTAVERGIPGIAFSAQNTASSYQNTTANATIAAQLSVNLVNRIAKNTPKGARLLPVGYGLNVNYPYFTNGCVNPPFVKSRIAGGAGMPIVALNATSGLIIIAGGNYYGDVSEGLNTCYNGDCFEPGESVVVTTCQSSVSIFTVDYDAPRNYLTEEVREKIVTV
jgi:5'-nucleotidase